MPVRESEILALVKAVERITVVLETLETSLERVTEKIEGNGNRLGYGEQLRSLDRRIGDLEKKQKEHTAGQWTLRMEALRGVFGLAGGAVGAAVIKWLLG